MATNEAGPNRTEKVQIVPVRTPEDLGETINLFYEYTQWLDLDLKFQDFDQEMANMPGKYVLPTGELLLAKMSNGAAAGCVALRAFEGDICEMKRLWVRDLAKGAGVGRKLVVAIIEVARKQGYRRMRLDTLPRMAAAVGLYRSLGFVNIPPYYSTPLADTHFLELDLTKVS